MRCTVIKSSRGRIPRKKVAAVAKAIEEQEEPPEGQVSIIFVTDREIRRLNRRFRHIDKATDVLSFNIDTEASPNAVLGEVYISTETANRNAREDGISSEEMIIRLCVHGILHLLGYDHKSRRERTSMESKERLVLSRVGIG